MTHYAVLYNEDTNHYAIIFQEKGDPLFLWHMYQDEITKFEVAETIAKALNDQEAKAK